MNPEYQPLSPDEIGELEEITLSPDMEARLLEAEKIADRDAEEVRIAMRWKRGQLALIRRAAAGYGIPYQTYIKQAATRQAIADLQTLERTRARS